MSKSSKRLSLPELSGLELEIMNIVWDLGECSSGEVIEACRRVRPLADTTVRTVLSNIRKKGYLEQVPTIERGFRFRPTVSRSAVAKRSLNKLVRRLFKDSRPRAIAYLLSDSKISEEELDAIRRLLDEHEPKTKKE